MTQEQADAFLKAAGGDEEKAAAMAKQAGYDLTKPPIAPVIRYDAQGNRVP